MISVQHEISFVPSHKTVVDAGHSHFSRVADALAEFVDNSIQATQKQPETRDIKLGLDLDFHGNNDSFLSILDNGEGMDQDTLSAFGVYALDKESRGLKTSNENTSNISKFGVGAKQAGFFLGTRIHVLTSPAGSSQIFELIMDKNVFEEKFHNKEDVFKGHISSHDVRSLVPSATGIPLPDHRTEGSYNKRLQQVVNKLFEDKIQLSVDGTAGFEKSFTLITIQLRKFIQRKLHRADSYKDLATQLADIYHFHLHPENLPNPVSSRTFEKYGQEPNLEHTKPIREKRGQAQSRDNSLAPLNISFQLVENEKKFFKELPLNVLRDLNSRYFQHMKHCFRFNIDLPDPDPRDRGDTSKETSSLTQSGTVEGERKTVQGLILYFPSEGGHETMPTSNIAQHPLPLPIGAAKTSGNIRRNSTLQSIEDSTDDEECECKDGEERADDISDEALYQEVEDLTEDDDSSVCRIYWQNRLVPGSKVNKLSFFPDAKTLVQCDRLGIPPEWSKRIKCFLFFDANFHNISNNKLTINVDPDLQTWITSKSVVDKTIYYPNKTKEQFPKWLKTCTDRFDQQYVYSDPFDSRDQLEHVTTVYARGADAKRNKEDMATLHLFKRFEFSLNMKKIFFDVGQIVKLCVPASILKKQNGTTSRSKKTVMAKILGFVKFCHLPLGAMTSYGQGFIWYQHMPEEVFGSCEHVVMTSCLDLSKGNDIIVTPLELENVRKQAPCMVKVEVLSHAKRSRTAGEDCDSSEGVGNAGDNEIFQTGLFQTGQVSNVSARTKFSLPAAEPVDIIVTVLSGFNKLVLNPPDQSHKKYTVRLRIAENDFGTSSASALFIKRIDAAKSISFDKYSRDSKIFEGTDVVHYFQKVAFKTSNVKKTMTVDVLDGTRIVISKTFTVEITAGLVCHFEIEDSPFFDRRPLEAMLGSYIPSFSLSFFDHQKNGNRSCSFISAEASNSDALEDSSPPSQKCDADNSYWVLIKSRDGGMNVELLDAESGCYVQKYKIPEKDIKDIIAIPSELFLPLPDCSDDLRNAEENAKRDIQISQLLSGACGKESLLSCEWDRIGVKEPFISCTAVERRVVTFDVTTNLCPGVTQSFSITFTPGYPARICLLGMVPADVETQVTVRNGERLPDLTVACFDTFNNRTDPEAGTDWHIELVKGGPIVCNDEEMFRVQKGGTAVLRGLVMNATTSAHASAEMIVEQQLELVWPAEEIMSQIVLPRYLLKARVLKGKRPESIEILLHGRRITSLTVSESVGAVVTGLSVRVLDESGDVWENSEGWVVHTSWEADHPSASRLLPQSAAVHRSQNNSSTLDNIMDFELPTTFDRESNIIEYTVECIIMSPLKEFPLKGDFNVKLEPKPVVRWEICDRKANVNDSPGLTLRCDDEEDLFSSIRGICAVDQYGNESSDFSFLTCENGKNNIPVPTLVVKWDDDEITTQDNQVCLTGSLPPSVTWTSRSHRYRHTFGLALEPEPGVEPGRYLLRTTESLHREHPDFVPNTIISNNLSLSQPSRPFWIYCLDAKNVLQPSGAVRGMLVSGVPAAVHLRCESIMKSIRGEEVDGGDDGDETEEQRPPDTDSSVQEPGQGADDDSSGREELFNVPFAPKSKLNDLKIILVDSCGNVVNLKKLVDVVKDVALQVEFDPSIINPDPGLPPAVCGQYVESVFSKAINKKSFKNGVKAAIFPVVIEFERVFNPLVVHQNLREGTLTDLICKASYYRVSRSEAAAGGSRGKVTKKRPLQRHSLASSGDIATVGGDDEGGTDVRQPQVGVPEREEGLASKVHLKPARLNCTFRKLDLVTSVEVGAISASEDTDVTFADEIPQLSSGMPFQLKVVLSSEQSNFLTEPQIRDIQIIAMHSDGGGRPNVEFDLVNDIESFLAQGDITRPPGQSESMQRTITFPPLQLTERGHYTFKVIYKESRSHLASSSLSGMIPVSQLKLTEVFKIEVLPGVGQKLLPSPATEPMFSGRKKAKASISRFQEMHAAISPFESKICVTDSSSSGAQERRLIPEGNFVEICLYDEYGNVVEFPSSREYVCVCQVKHRRGYDNENHPNYIPTQQDVNVRNLRLPTLEGSNDQGFLAGKLVSSDTYQFPCLALREFEATQDSNGAGTQLHLVFSLMPVGDAARQKLEVESHKVVFNYTSDESLAQARRRQAEQLEPLTEQLSEYTLEIQNKKTEYSEAIEKLEILLGQCHDQNLNSYKSDPKDLYDEDVRQNCDSFESTLSDAHDQNGTQGVRVSVKDEMQVPVIAPGGGFLGLVVDLAFVEDDKDARVLSWAAGARAVVTKSSSSSSSKKKKKAECDHDRLGGGLMKALVFESATHARKLVKQENLSYFPLDRMAPAPASSCRDLCDSFLVDLPDILLIGSQRAPAGNPRHMVNVLELKVGEPYHLLRAKVFHAIFKNKILMDTEKDAIKYIDHLLHKGQSDIPTIYTRDGRCFRGDGLVTADDRMPANLDFVFGAPPSEGQSTIEDIKSDLKILKEIKEVVKKRDRATQAIEDLERRRNETHAEIDQVKHDFATAQKQQQHLNRHLTQHLRDGAAVCVADNDQNRGGPGKRPRYEEHEREDEGGMHDREDEEDNGLDGAHASKRGRYGI